MIISYEFVKLCYFKLLQGHKTLIRTRQNKYKKKTQEQ